MRYRLTGLAIVALCGAANAAEVLDSQFQVEITKNGETTTSADPMVPFLPDEACYYWFVQVAAGEAGEVPMVERLVLPAPATAWDPEDGDTATKIVVDADGKGVTTTFSAKPDADGWINGGWCVAEGDPLGQYSLSVDVDGQSAGEWAFSVVPADDYSTPAHPDAPARAVPDSPTARG